MKNIIISTAMFCFTLLTCAGFTQNSVFKISFNSDGTTFNGVLLAYDDNDWLLRIRYYDASCNCDHIIQEWMRVEIIKNLGFKLRGYDVKDVISGEYASTDQYVADNFYLYKDTYGNMRITNIDNQLSISDVSIQNITSSQWNSVLRSVKWTYSNYSKAVVNTQ